MKGTRRLLEGKEGKEVAMVRDALEHAADQALRAGDVIRRLRDFVARGESEKQVHNLRKLVEEASALALVGAKDQGIHTSFHFHEADDSVLADKVQIQQVLLNLMRNAMEAMGHSQRRILSVSTEPSDDGMVAVVVSDTGTGIAPEIVEQLFQPFITSKPTGLGVGLSISKTIVEAHGGRIAATANPDGGTAFRFTLRSAARKGADDAG